TGGRISNSRQWKTGRSNAKQASPNAPIETASLKPAGVRFQTIIHVPCFFCNYLCVPLFFLLCCCLIQFFIKGVMYSPSPIGSHPSWTWPHGDFFIPQYQNLWARDFPLLQALGANTIRIANWNNEL